MLTFFGRDYPRMVHAVTARRAGGSLTIALPRSQAQRLCLMPGNEVWLANVDDGVLASPVKNQLITREDTDMESVLVSRAGGSLTIVLPKRQVAHLEVEVRRTMWVADVPCGLLISASDDQFSDLGAMLQESGAQFRLSVDGT